MSRCIIITAYNEHTIAEALALAEKACPSLVKKPDEQDFVICADGGYRIASKENIIPDVLIGDFDSLTENQLPEGVSPFKVFHSPSEKDDTDTMLCLKYAISHNYNNIILVGGLGGRLDHSLANIQTLAYGCSKNKNVYLVDKNNAATVLCPTQTSSASLEVERIQGFKVSLIAHDTECTGVNISGVYYHLVNATLSNIFPLGVSNEIIGNKAKISVSKGKLLVILSKD